MASTAHQPLWPACGRELLRAMARMRRLEGGLEQVSWSALERSAPRPLAGLLEVDRGVRFVTDLPTSSTLAVSKALPAPP